MAPWRKFVQDELAIINRILLDDGRIINYIGETEAVLTRVVTNTRGTWDWFVVEVPPGFQLIGIEYEK